MGANFFVKPNESFTVTVPFDVSDPEDPQLIFAETIEDYPRALKEIDEENISFETMKWKKPTWGMDCYLRELAYDGSSVRDRTFSLEKFDLIRLKHLLVDSSFFNEQNSVSTAKSGNYDALSPTSEEYIKQINPFVLKVFLLIASRVWDLGTPAKSLLTKEDYLLLRNDKDGLRTVSETKGFIRTTPDAKKKNPLTTKSSKPDLAKPALETPIVESPTG